MATRSLLADLAQRYQRQTGHPVAIEAVGGVDAARRIRAGEATDIVVLAAHPMEQLEAEGHLQPGSRRAIAASGIAMAVRSDGERPSQLDEASVRKAMLKARKVGYSTGPSGQHLERMWARWGIKSQMADRILQAPPGVPVATLLAEGKVEVAFQQLSELIHAPGIHVVGLLPATIQSVTVFVAGVCTRSDRAGEAQALVNYLASREADAVKPEHGLDPAS